MLPALALSTCAKTHTWIISQPSDGVWASDYFYSLNSIISHKYAYALVYSLCRGCVMNSCKFMIYVHSYSSGQRRWYWTGHMHDDVIKWKHFPRYWPLVWGIHRSPVNSPLKGEWRGALMFSLICAWINGWANNGEAGDLRHHRAHYDVTVMDYPLSLWSNAEGPGLYLTTTKRQRPLLLTWINFNPSMDK